MEPNNDDKEIDLRSALDSPNGGVKFKNDKQASRSYYSGTPKVIQFIIKCSGGYIKDEKRAVYAILGFVVLAIIISLFLILGGGPRGQSLENRFPPGSPALRK